MSSDKELQTTFEDHVQDQVSTETQLTPAVTLNIETINLVPDADFHDPTAWEPFVIAVAFRNTKGVESEVFLKTNRSPCGELRMYDDVVDWIETHEPERILTYGGSSHDIPIIKHRGWHEVRECPDRVDSVSRLDDLLHELDHIDLMNYVRKDRGYSVSLEEELENQGIEVEKLRHNDEVVTGADMPNWGRQVTRQGSDEETAALLNVIRRYAESNVVPLFELHDNLVGSRTKTKK